MPFPEMTGTPMPLGELVLRVSLAFWVLLALTRIMGRKQISQLTFFDYVTGISIGSIAAALAIDNSIPVVTCLASLALWTAWVMLVNLLTLKSVPARKFIDGEPIVVIRNGQILKQNLGTKFYNIDDLMMELRENGIFDPGEVQIGVAEPDGKLSVLKKARLQPVTAQDMNLPANPPADNYLVGKELIIDGEIIEENLRAAQVDEKWLRQQLNSRGIGSAEQVLLAALTPQGGLYVAGRRNKGGRGGEGT